MRQPSIGRAELEVLHYVADHHPIAVREVADHFAKTKGHTRTTLLNVMERLRRKRFLTRRKVSGVYQYSLRQPKPHILRDLVRQFVEESLGGSLSPFVAYLTRDAKLSADELAALRKLVHESDAKERT